jgi:molybdopterin/thiamine biosynthesis adenylyltransferase
LHKRERNSINTVGYPKAQVMAGMARAINPACEIRLLEEDIHPGNLETFLTGCDIVIDGLDFFSMRARRDVFRRARERRIPVITCGPMGFSVAMLLFLPESPSFDAFMAINDRMSEWEQLAHFAVGLAPAGLHFPYIDPQRVSFREHRGPSSMIAVNLCAALAASEALNLLLKRRPSWSVPRYAQFDAYRLQFRKGILPGGNRHPVQRVKLWYLRRRLRSEDSCQGSCR